MKSTFRGVRMPYCWKCGAELKEDAKFCHKCGASVAGPIKVKKDWWE